MKLVEQSTGSKYYIQWPYTITAHHLGGVQNNINVTQQIILFIYNITYIVHIY